MMLALGALPPQDLARGECALFLWSRDPAPALVLVARAGSARVSWNGRQRDLARADGADGAVAAKARYADEALSIDLDVELERREGLSGGAIVRAGTIETRETGGDTILQPVGGLLACR